MNVAVHLTGIEVQAFGLGLIAYANDFEMRAGPYALTLLPDGLFLRCRSGERDWRWWEVRDWLRSKLPF